MKAGEIRKELESYGISTKSFLEKKEMVAALEKARAEGLKPKETKAKKTATKSTSNGSEQVNGADKKDTSAKEKKDDTKRQEKLQKEKEKAKKMKVGELKKALQDMGISTKSFFEKPEFVQAYAEAMVDGPPNKKGAGGRGTPRQEEYDPSYRDVTMQKVDRDRDLRLLTSPVIDTKIAP